MKKTAKSYTVLKIKSVFEKELHVSNLEISHPSLVHQENSNESKKRTSLQLSSTGDYEVDSTVDGRTNEFDEVPLENLIHEYINSLLITRNRNASAKRRDSIDENTKVSVKKDNNKRSMGDIGGSNILSGLEVKTLENTYVNGELAEFKEILSELSRAYFVESVEAYVGNLNDIGERSFVFLDDGVTPRRYIVSYVKLR